MSEADSNTEAQIRKIIRVAIPALVLGSLVAVALVYICATSHPSSPMEELAKEFYRIDDDALYWDYEAIFKAYNECRDSIRQKQLLDLMVKSQAAHLVPRIIDSIRPGGFMNTERKIRAIIELTGQDFSREFDIKGIWEREHIEKTKRLLHQWWDQNHEEVLHSRGPKEKANVPNYWPSLTLALRTEKDEYLQLEPIRITTILESNSDTWFTFTYKLRKPAFAIEYFRVLDDGSLVSVARTSCPASWIICGHTRTWFAKPRFLVIDADSCHIVQQWLNKYDENCFEPGKVTIRAILEPLRGEHKGKQLMSNDLKLNIQEPQGPDAAAYKFITRRAIVDIGDGRKFGPGFMRGGLIRHSGSHHGRPVHEYFLNNYGDSVYADYVRYTLATDSLDRNPEVFYKQMSDIAGKAPRDFPLLVDSYVNLLECYKKRGELEKMTALSQTIKPRNVTIVDPRLSKRLSDLMSHAENVERRVHFKGYRGRTPLHDAAEKGPTGLVKFLITKGANVNEKDDNGQTPLHHATKEGHKEIVEILIASGAAVNIKNRSFGRTPLFWPAWNGHKEIVELLIANGANVNVKENSGRTPIHWAMGNNQEEIVTLLILNRADVNARSNNGMTPLHWAVQQTKKEIVELLLAKGARVDLKDNRGQTPLDIANEYAKHSYQHKEIATILREDSPID
jgi:ankyrin repeat protein